MFLSVSDFAAQDFHPVASLKLWKKRNPLPDILKTLSDLEISSRAALADVVNENYSEFVDLVSSKVKGIAPPDLPKPLLNLEISSLAAQVKATLEQSRSARQTLIADRFFNQVISRSRAMRSWPPASPAELRRLEQCCRAFPFSSELRATADLEISETWKFLINQLLSELIDRLGNADVSEIVEKLFACGAEAQAADAAVEKLVLPKLNLLASEITKFDLGDFLGRLGQFPEISSNFQVPFDLEMKRRVASFIELKFPGLFLPTDDLKLFAWNFNAWQKFFSLVPEFTGKWKLSIFNSLKQKFKFPTLLERMKFVWQVRVDPLFPRDLEISLQLLRNEIKLPVLTEDAIALVTDIRDTANFAREEISRSCPELLKPKVLTVLEMVMADCLKNLEKGNAEIAERMAKPFLVFLENARQVPSLYRMTSKGAPTRQSAYVDSFLNSATPDQTWKLLVFRLVISRFDFIITEMSAKEEIPDFAKQQLKLDIEAISQFFGDTNEMIIPILERLR